LGEIDNTLLEEKVLYRTLKGSINTTYLEPLKGSTLLKKGFLWVLYCRTLGLHTWPIEPFTKKIKKKKMVLYRTILEFHMWSGGWNHFWF